MSTRIESAEHCIIVNGVLYPKGVLRACIEGNLLNVWEDLERTIPLVNSVPYNEIIHVNTGSPFASSSALSDFVKEHFFFKRIKNLSELINDVGYLTSETDPTVPGHVKSITTTHISQWDTAYGWGDHAGLYPLLSGSYANPSWVNSLAWSKITGKPTSLSGYGITDAYTQTQIQDFFLGTSAISGYNKAQWDAAYGFTSGFDSGNWILNQHATIQTATARINGQLEAGQGRFTAWNSFGTGAAVEAGISLGSGFVVSYDRTASAFIPLILQGGSGTGASSYIDVNQNAIEVSNFINIINTASDTKIRFNRIGGKVFRLEHDATQFYLYNQTDTIVTQRWLNSGQVAFDYYAGTGDRLSYLNQYGLLIRSSIDPANIFTTSNVPTLQQVATAGNTYTGTLTLQGTTFGNSTINSTVALSLLNSGSAQQILTGGILASDNYSDASFIPANGIYSKGNMQTAGRVGIGVSPTNARLEVVQTTGEIFRADANGGAFRIVADQTGVLMQGTIGIYNLSGTGNRLAYFDASGNFGRSSIDLSTVLTSIPTLQQVATSGNTFTGSVGLGGNLNLTGNSFSYIVTQNIASGSILAGVDVGGVYLGYEYGSKPIYIGNNTTTGGILLYGSSYNFNALAGTGNRLAYVNSSGNLLATTLDPSTIATTSTLTGYVPYTGATTNVDLNSRSLTATGIASLNILPAGAVGVANGNIWIARSSDGLTITDMTTDGSYSITNNVQGSGYKWNVSGLNRMQLSGSGSLSVLGSGSAYSFVDRTDNNKGWILYADGDLGRLASSNGLLVGWDFYTGAQINYYHNRNQYGTHALSGNSYYEGNYEAAVTNAAYTAGARAGYGFHTEGIEGIYLYAEGDNKLRVRNGSVTNVIAYETWVNNQIGATTWADVLDVDPSTQGHIPNIYGANYTDTRILFTNTTIDNPYELVAGHHNDASNEGFSLYDQNNDSTRFWFGSSGQTYFNDQTIYLPNIPNIILGAFVSFDPGTGMLGYRTHSQVRSDIGAQTQLNGTGFVKVSGTAVSYDNTVYTPQANISGTTDLIPKFISANAIASPVGQYRLGGWLNLDRYSNTAAGISFYGGPGGSHNTWQLYMSPGGQASTGVQGDLTAPTGDFVNSWALRSLIENSGGYGWTWEAMANSGTTPTIAAELNQDGNFRTGTLKITKFLPESVQEGAIIVDRTIPNGSGNENARGFKDNTTFARNGYAYASYDAVAHFASGGTYPHYTAFQMRPTIQGSVNSVEFGATYFESSVPISRFIGLLHEPPKMYGNTLTDSYAVKVEPFGPVGVNNWVIYSSDPNIHSYHGGDFTAGYFNQSSSDSENSSVDQIITTTGNGDNYFRKVDKAHFLTELGITPYWSHGPHNLIQPHNPDVVIEGVNFDNHRLHLEADAKINTSGTYYSLSATDNVITNVDSNDLNVRLPNPGDDGQRGRQLKFRQLNSQSEIYFFDVDGNATYLYDYYDGTTHWGVHRLVNAGNNIGAGVGYEWVEVISMDMTSVEKDWQWVIVQQGGSLEFASYREAI